LHVKAGEHHIISFLHLTGNAFLVGAGEMSNGVCCPEKGLYPMYRKGWDGMRWYRMVWDGIGWYGMAWHTEETEDVRMQSEITVGGKKGEDLETDKCKCKCKSRT